MEEGLVAGEIDELERLLGFRPLDLERPQRCGADCVVAFAVVPVDDRCLGIFYLGYPANPAEWPQGRRKPIAEKIEWVDA